MTDGEHSWVSWTGDSWVELPPERRARVRRSMIDRHRARGPLLAVVQVRVDAEDQEAQVSFPDGSVLGLDADPETIAAVVARARDALTTWR
jgi:hypothetical protein